MLGGLKQLSGLSIQRLMEKGYGFGAEGDWKVAAMVRMMKLMTAGIKGAKGTSMMEDYTYNLVFTSKTGPAVACSLVDLGTRFRLLGTAFWTPKPNLEVSAAAWILAGGAHHTAFSYDLTVSQMTDWADAMGIESVVIDENTDICAFKNELKWNMAAYK